MIIAGCAGNPTPLPVIAPSATPAASPTPPPNTVAYALTEQASALLTQQDIAMLLANGSVTIVNDAADAGGYDIIISAQPFQGSQPLPRTIGLGVEFSEYVPPLDNPIIRSSIRAILDSAADLTQIREAFANAGYPDGMLLNIQAEPRSLLLFLPVLTSRFAEYPIRTQIVEAAAPHIVMRLVDSASSPIIPIETFTLHFRVNPDLNFFTTDEGLPLAAR